MSSITEQLLEALDAAIADGDTVRDIGERAGLHFTTVARYARRDRLLIPIEDAAALARALDLDLTLARRKPDRV